MAVSVKLRPYQVEAGRAILDSVLHRWGLTFTVEMARQGGKNELSAQLELLLLTLFMGIGGNGIKCAPTLKPQMVTSMQRLKERLQEAGFSRFWVPEQGYIFRLGKARQVFLSAQEQSHVVGATAHLLLEVDEAQEVDREKYAKEFRPMGAATNVTNVLYGTPWDDSTLLEQVKQENLERERKDGIKRHFRYDWQEVAKYNPLYLSYVEAEQERLGGSHPLFQTQYCLNPVSGGGRFLSPSQRAQLQGDHPHLHRPAGKGIFVAGVDLAGEGEGPEDAALRALKPRQDSTVVTIGELDFSTSSEAMPFPQVRVLEHYWWTGKPHVQLYPQLLDVLKHVWGCRRVVVDATGVGEGVASFLASALGSAVLPFRFTAQSKSKLGFGLLAAVNSGRLKIYAPDGSPECQEFWRETEKARSAYRPNQTMNFFVDPSEGHDDFLMSLALLVEAAEYEPSPGPGAGPGRAGSVKEADVLPEQFRYQDEGCELHHSCLRCPLPLCRYDEPDGEGRRARRLRDSEIRRLRFRGGLSIRELSRRYGVSQRTIHRILRRLSHE